MEATLSWSFLSETENLSPDNIDESDELAIKVELPDDNFDWIGLAFNDQNVMEGGDGVIGIPKDDSVLQYTLLHHNVDRNEAQDLVEKRLVRENGHTSLAIIRKLGAVNDKMRNLAEILRERDMNIFVFVAKAGVSLSGDPQSHSSSDRLRATVNFVTGESTIIGDDFTMTVVHGVLMTVAWGIISPVAIATALFLKQCAPVTKNVMPPWLKIHITLQVTAVLLTLAGILVKFEDLGGWVFRQDHHKLGTAVFCLACFQILNGCFRPHRSDTGKKGKLRVAWEFLHILGGATVATMAIFAIVSGLLVSNAVNWIYISVIVFVIVWISASFLGLYLFSKFSQSNLSNRRGSQTGLESPIAMGNPIRSKNVP